MGSTIIGPKRYFFSLFDKRSTIKKKSTRLILKMNIETLARLENATNINEKIAILLNEKYSYEAIIKILRVSPKTISKVNSALKNGDDIPPVGKRGQPTKKTSEVITCTIQETVNNPRLPASAIQVIIQTKTGIRVSISKILQS